MQREQKTKIKQVVRTTIDKKLLIKQYNDVTFYLESVGYDPDNIKSKLVDNYTNKIPKSDAENNLC